MLIIVASSLALCHFAFAQPIDPNKLREKADRLQGVIIPETGSGRAAGDGRAVPSVGAQDRSDKDRAERNLDHFLTEQRQRNIEERLRE